MNSNGIPEMIRAAGRSKYVTPGMPWWGWFILAALLVTAGYASASPSCMTLHEAREVWPNTYLSWRGDHCWFAKYGGTHEGGRKTGGHKSGPWYGQCSRTVPSCVPLPKEKPFVLLLEQAAADPSFEVRWRARIYQ